jgi:hypothetical protein
MNLPAFLIVGTMKSGTSSLANYLNLHPEIYIPSMEIHFFERDSNYQKGIEWYESFFSRKKKKIMEKGYDWYLKYIKKSQEKFFLVNNNKLKENDSAIIFGEKTPTYSYSIKAAERIALHLPDVKLIWIFRNPVNRAYSHYLYNYSNGATLLSFDDILKIGGKSKNYHLGVDICDYLEMGIYSDQIRTYLEYFNKSKMYFLLFEEFIKNPVESIQNIYKFLNIDYKIKLPPSLKINVTKLPKSNYPLWVLRSLYHKLTNTLGDLDLLYYFYSLAFIILQYVYSKANIRHPRLDETLRDRLIEFYKPYNEELTKLTGLNLEKWNEGK